MSTDQLSKQPEPCLKAISQSTLGSSDSTLTEKDLGQVDSKDSGDEGETIVHWASPSDPQNPMNWPDFRKWLTIGLISFSSFNVSMVSTIFAPGVPNVLREFHTNDSALSSLVVSIYVMGAAIGPLILTPLTEMSGRLPMTHTSNILFLIAAIVCATSINMPMMIASRFVMGVASAVPVTVGGGYVADLMPMERRGIAMTIWTVGPLGGFVIGPIFGGFMVQNIGWRWTIWLEVILGALIVIASFVFLRETYAPIILQKKAMKLHKATGRRFTTKFDTGQTKGQMMRTSIVRPIKFLFLSPIVLIVSLYSAVTYSYMYVLFTTFTKVFESVYKFSSGQAGLGYLGLGLGFCVGQVSVGYFTDRYVKRQEAIHGKMRPEDRLPPLVVGCFLVPVGLFWYGWSAEYQLHWIVPISGTFFVGLGIFFVHLVTQVYLVDSYTLYAASAVSAELCIRSVFGATIPLGGPALYESLGLGWGNTLLGFIALAFAPLTFLLIKYGESLRTNPKFMPKMT